MADPQRDALKEDTPPSGHTAKRWPIGRLAAVLLIAIIFAASTVTYNVVATFLAHRWDAAQDRDPETGILAEAEPIDLGPEDADVAVLLVHGFIGSSTNFGELPNALAAKGYRVRALLLPGHGTTPFELRGTSDSEMLQAVLDELDTLKANHDRVFIVGHSMGSALSTLAASKNGTDGLVIAAPYFQVTHQWYYILSPETWTSLTGWAIKWLYKGDTFIRVNRKEAKDDILSYRWVPTKATVNADRIATQARSPETLKNLTCPVLLMHSPDDFAASPKAAQRAFEQIATEEKELLWLENSDHHLFFDYDREQAIQATLDFIARLANS